jgi:DNA-binding PadR family transcriptional regulator
MRAALANARREWRRPPQGTLLGTLLALERRGLIELREHPIVEYRRP